MDILKNFKIFGWSRSTFSVSNIYVPKTLSEISEVLKETVDNNMNISLKGLGRSYGDTTLNSNNNVLDLSKFNKILKYDKNKGLIVCESGVTIERIFMSVMLDNWTLPSMPGTRFVSLGGALGNNIHGKNAYFQSCIGDYVEWFEILLTDGSIKKCSPSANSELFYSAIGGFGLLGIIVKVCLKLMKVKSPYIAGHSKKFNNFESLIKGYEKIKDNYQYSIAWIDPLKKNKSLGRGEISYGNLIISKDDLEIKKSNRSSLLNKYIIPFFARIAMNKFTLMLFNNLHYVTSIMSRNVHQVTHLFYYHFLMDEKFPNYNFFFKSGFYLYQPIVPFNNAGKVLKQIIKITHKYKFYSYMSSVKVYKRPNRPFLLSFPIDGYSLTMDIPRIPTKLEEQKKMFYEINELLIQNKGKIYIAKTPVMSFDQAIKMYPNFKKFLKLKKKYDPLNIFQNNFLVRVFGNKLNLNRTINNNIF